MDRALFSDSDCGSRRTTSTAGERAARGSALLQQHTKLPQHRRLSHDATDEAPSKHVLLRARPPQRQGPGARGTLQSSSPGHSPIDEDGQEAMRTQAGQADCRQQAEPGLVGVYTGWLAQDNLGDEIVADIFLDLFTAAIIEATDAGTCVSLERASLDLATAGWRGCTLTNNSACDFGVMGGGSTISVDYIRRIEGILAADKQVLLFGSGHQSGLHQTAEAMDKYLRILCRAQLTGGVRGPYTEAHLHKYGCSNRSVPIIRDSGLIARLLYHKKGPEGPRGPRGPRTLGGPGVPEEPGGPERLRGAGHYRPQLQQQLQAHTSGRRRVIAMTLKEACLPIVNETIMTLLASGKYAIVLQAVDNQTVRLHLDFQERLNQDLPPGAAPIMVHSEHQDWAAVLSLYSHTSASLNCRLHSGVLSASALRPTLFVASNSKFQDFCTSLVDHSSRRVRKNRAALTSAVGFGSGSHSLLDNIEQAINRSSTTRRILEQLQHDTLLKYKAVMANFMLKLEEQDPARFRSTLCCKNIRVVRSVARDKRVLIKVECVQDLEQVQPEPSPVPSRV